MLLWFRWAWHCYCPVIRSNKVDNQRRNLRGITGDIPKKISILETCVFEQCNNSWVFLVVVFFPYCLSPRIQRPCGCLKFWRTTKKLNVIPEFLTLNQYSKWTLPSGTGCLGGSAALQYYPDPQFRKCYKH